MTRQSDSTGNPRTPGVPDDPAGAATDRAATTRLFERMIDRQVDDSERALLRQQLVEMHLPLVDHLAGRFRSRGEPLDDLVQVGTVGLIKSVDRFDPFRGVEFSTYATPTIVGELKRHFRDKGWAVRVPRRLQELRLSLGSATSELTQELGRSPTVAELADRLDISSESVLEGLESSHAYNTVSLDAPDQADDDDSPAPRERIGGEDTNLAGVEYREALRPSMDKLSDREKRILQLRFFGGMTQSQIAADVGISQMHVSRILTRTLSHLRQELLHEDQ